jgi:hypothetical protein
VVVVAERVVVERIVVPPVVVIVVEVVVGILDPELDVGEGAGAFPEQAVVEALLQFPRFTEPASSSFSRHVSPALQLSSVRMLGQRRGQRPRSPP